MIFLHNFFSLKRRRKVRPLYFPQTFQIQVYNASLFFYFWLKSPVKENPCSLKVLSKPQPNLNTAQDILIHLSTPCRQFWGPLATILDFAVGAALQAVSECPSATRLVFITNLL